MTVPPATVPLVECDWLTQVTPSRQTVVGIFPAKNCRISSGSLGSFVAVAIAIAFTNAVQPETAQATQGLTVGLILQLPDNLSAQQACAAQAKIYLQEREAETKRKTERNPRWDIFLFLGASYPYTSTQNHYNQRLHRCLVVISTVENDPIRDDLTTDVKSRLTRIEVMDPFEQASVLTCSDPIPLRLTDSRTGKTTLLPSSRGWKCSDADNHQISIEESIALMDRLMRE